MMEEKYCSIEGCNKVVKTRGICASHYSKFWRSKEFTPASNFHKLSNVDKERRKGNCSICGEIDVWLTNPNRPIPKFQCFNARKVSKIKWRIYNLYDMNPEKYYSMLEEQNGMCAANCGRKVECVDHDHVTGKTRALLCQHCNKALGFVNDSIFQLENLICYLKEHE